MAFVFNPLGRETNYNLLKLRSISLPLSALLVLTSIALMFFPGFNLGIDFTGGTQITVPLADGQSLIEVQRLLQEVSPFFANIEVQAFDASARFIMPQPTANDLAATGILESQFNEFRRDEALAALGLDTSNAAVTFETIGGQVSGELQVRAAWAVAIALAAISVYIAVRFEWRFAIAALIALLHDALTTLGLFALLGLEVNLEVVAAVLTIAGYSINDTVVVFDRIREEMRRSPDEPLMPLLNRALNRTLSRTLMTSVTTLLALFGLFIFAGADVREFSIALIWGVIIGTYSSIFLATPLLTVLSLSGKVFERKQLDMGEVEDSALAWAATLEDTSVETTDGETVEKGTAPKRTKGKPRKGKAQR